MYSWSVCKWGGYLGVGVCNGGEWGRERRHRNDDSKPRGGSCRYVGRPVGWLATCRVPMGVIIWLFANRMAISSCSPHYTHLPASHQYAPKPRLTFYTNATLTPLIKKHVSNYPATRICTYLLYNTNTFITRFLFLNLFSMHVHMRSMEKYK